MGNEPDNKMNNVAEKAKSYQVELKRTILVFVEVSQNRLLILD